MTLLLNGDGMHGRAAPLSPIANPLFGSGAPSDSVGFAANQLLWPAARRTQMKRILVAAGEVHSIVKKQGGLLYWQQQAAGCLATASRSVSHEH